MPITDTIAPREFDLREISSDWRLNCAIHGPVTMVRQYDGDWARTFCCDCIEADDAKQSRKVTLNPNGGPPFPVKV